MSDAPTASPPPQVAPAPRRRWLWGVAIVSVAANLLVAGFVAGHFMRGGGPFGDRHGPRMMERVVMRHVSEENRPRVRQILDEYLQTLRELRRERREKRRAVADALLAPEVDREAAKMAIDTALNADRKLKQTLGSLMVSLAPYLPQHVRRKVVRRLMRRGPRGR